MKGIKYIKKYEKVHTKEVQAIIKEENKNKAGIYMLACLFAIADVCGAVTVQYYKKNLRLLVSMSVCV